MDESNRTAKRLLVLGAAGRTGRLAVEEALRRGHHVTAFVRTPAKISVPHARLTVVQGDLTDAAAVERAVPGHDAVLMLAGQSKGSPRDLLAMTAHHLLPAMKKHDVRRLVTLLGAGVSAPGDGPPSLGRRVMLRVMKLIASHVLEDAQRHFHAVVASGLDWTVLRPPRLTLGPSRGHVQAQPYLPLGPRDQLPRGDLARFAIDVAEAGTFLREAPMVKV